MKIFLPNSIFYGKKNCEIYGDFIQNEEKNKSAFYVVEAAEHKSDKGDTVCQLRRIGLILEANVKKSKEQFSLIFRYDENTPNIYMNCKENENWSNINLYLYKPKEFLRINESITSPKDDLSKLGQLVLDFENAKLGKSQNKNPTIGAVLTAGLNLPLLLMTRLFIYIMETKIAISLLKRTTLYEHFLEWRRFHLTGKRNWNIALDKILGIIVMLVLLFYLHEPGEYVLEASHFIIDKLRLLLRSLKGSPIGLKLNVHLNNFFLDCFNYHIDLWATFLNIIEPSIQQLFVPITLLGSMGLSCQLALLSDLLSIVGLHAHCFYIYAAVLYKVEIQGLSVLWKVVRGKRYNLLSKRVESHNYMNRQLYLATIFFTTMLFLFPTILVYYIVFTTLRLCTYTANWLLKTLRRRILEFPLQHFYEWCCGNFKDRDGIQITHKNVTFPTVGPKKVCLSVFQLHVQSSSLDRVFLCKSGVLQELKTSEDLTLKNICRRILEGKF